MFKRTWINVKVSTKDMPQAYSKKPLVRRGSQRISGRLRGSRHDTHTHTGGLKGVREEGIVHSDWFWQTAR